ncbi:transcriptional regulator, ArsR family [Frankia casuarinae]|jgi:DNA-binding transcriptional ArsR family regulator|uniref:Transcriptional regulator, ArsR family n=1 Tax=Frankia casuarinae (strain DSM 45818 / CECT 9043 / HFP020203 / CcI3) TaxID=106370 RepID=Q2J9T1_FRACC|nr:MULTISPECIES: metalloregulator ArsR/SmtB family transcription factor [Frankia]ABD11961.1 transcriptional regulator, ArsR family [Frankia casuarinae]ETA01899.1 transcriptional regulator, ArsR family [Frankia sp. CcI6]EYT92491.1 transcriptional regulator, ArsR family [Frankia casuarinae]KDA43004.1 transcriptional regulator, ArsR family [Frankia sp. BMG5.23]KEZ36508.1 transcriptional regulator, ArsR family [Frankia sp. CeD]
MVKVASHAEVLARFGHALSDPTRARLLLVLREGAAYPSDLAEILGVGRTNLSNHLACLRGCGLVVATPEGRRQRYELADDKLRHALDDLLGVVLAVDTDHIHPNVTAPVAAAAPGSLGGARGGVFGEAGGADDVGSGGAADRAALAGACDA